MFGSLCSCHGTLVQLACNITSSVPVGHSGCVPPPLAFALCRATVKLVADRRSAQSNEAAHRARRARTAQFLHRGRGAISSRSCSRPCTPRQSKSLACRTPHCQRVGVRALSEHILKMLIIDDRRAAVADLWCRWCSPVGCARGGASTGVRGYGTGRTIW